MEQHALIAWNCVAVPGSTWGTVMVSVSCTILVSVSLTLCNILNLEWTKNSSGHCFPNTMLIPSPPDSNLKGARKIFLKVFQTRMNHIKSLPRACSQSVRKLELFSFSSLSSHSYSCQNSAKPSAFRSWVSSFISFFFPFWVFLLLLALIYLFPPFLFSVCLPLGNCPELFNSHCISPSPFIAILPFISAHFSFLFSYSTDPTMPFIYNHGGKDWVHRDRRDAALVGGHRWSMPQWHAFRKE